MSNTRNTLSYSKILQDIQDFRGNSKTNKNVYDEPNTVYFKLIFYFNNPGDDVNSWTSNLLGLDFGKDGINDDITDDTINKNNWDKQMSLPAGFSKNTAYNYLMINDEKERADMLKQFILLLSEITSNSPWYFQSLSGVDTAIDKPFLETQQIADDRRSITIKCLPDAFDSRISSLMNLYRGALYSNINKREMIPGNLRKFDMGIYIFSTPTNIIHTKLSDIYKNVVDDKETYLKGVVGNSDTLSNYFTSCKYIELHNCEFDPKSGKEGYAELSNTSGTQLEHSINIFYDDAMESSYNEMMMKTVGDFVALDMVENYILENYTTKDKDNKDVDGVINKNINERLNISIKNSKLQLMSDYAKEPLKGYNSSKFEYIGKYWDPETGDYKERKPVEEKGLLGTMASNAIGFVKGKIDNKINSFMMGNAHGLSLTDISNISNSLLSGDIFGAAAGVTDQVKGAKYTVDRLKTAINGVENESKGYGNAHKEVLKNSGFKSKINTNAHDVS